jgi:hypothetical protein
MAGHKDDLDDDLIIDDSGDSSDDDFGIEEDEVDEDGVKTGKKSKSEGSNFDRDSYYLYKDKLVQLTGTVRPKDKGSDGKVISLVFKSLDDKNYTVVMDGMGTKLLGMCFQEILVTGHVSKVSEKEMTLAIKSYL